MSAVGGPGDSGQDLETSGHDLEKSAADLEKSRTDLEKSRNDLEKSAIALCLPGHRQCPAEGLLLPRVVATLLWVISRLL